jgi:arylsulfatase A
VICLTDLLATVADIAGTSLEVTAGVDSYSMLPAMLVKQDHPLRESTIHHSVYGYFAIRKGPWKLILCPGSGGWSDPKPKSSGIELLPPYQLYNLDNDPGETENLVELYPEVVEELSALLKQSIAYGRSTVGPKQANVASDIWPGLRWMEEKK